MELAHHNKIHLKENKKEHELNYIILMTNTHSFSDIIHAIDRHHLADRLQQYGW